MVKGLNRSYEYHEETFHSSIESLEFKFHLENNNAAAEQEDEQEALLRDCETSATALGTPGGGSLNSSASSNFEILLDDDDDSSSSSSSGRTEPRFQSSKRQETLPACLHSREQGCMVVDHPIPKLGGGRRSNSLRSCSKRHLMGGSVRNMMTMTSSMRNVMDGLRTCTTITVCSRGLSKECQPHEQEIKKASNNNKKQAAHTSSSTRKTRTTERNSSRRLFLMSSSKSECSTKISRHVVNAEETLALLLAKELCDFDT